MGFETLDAIALAALPEEVLIPKLAARARAWDRISFTGPTGITTVEETLAWVRDSFGPLLDHAPDRLGHAVFAEIRRQSAISHRRRRARHVDVPSKNPWARREVLVRAVLGPPSKHMSPKLLHVGRAPEARFADVLLSRDLVAGLVTGNELAGHRSVLVFRPRVGGRVRSVWVGPRDQVPSRPLISPARELALSSITDAIAWLTTPAVNKAVASGLRVELEWHKTRFRVHYPDGRTSTLPWRKRP